MGSEVAKSFEKVGINPRKTEQNRRAQARFRQRKKVSKKGSKGQQHCQDPYVRRLLPTLLLVHVGRVHCFLVL